MTRILFVTFDYHELQKPVKSLAVATLEAYLIERMNDLSIHSFSFNMNEEHSIHFEQMMRFKRLLSCQYDYVCVSMYAWNMRFVNMLISIIRKMQSGTRIIGGGYEVNTKTIDSLKISHPSVDHFIIGYAEESLYRIVIGTEHSKVVTLEVDNSEVATIYCNQIIDVNPGDVVRLETKRGCPFQCSYCSYRNNDHSKITQHNLDKVKRELRYLNDMNVAKVNVIDAIFGVGNHLRLLDYLLEIGFKPKLSIQMKFEILHAIVQSHPNYLKRLSQLDVTMEFGLQSINTQALSIVKRNNDLSKIRYMMDQLFRHKIDFEVSIIRGLPGETIDSYTELMRFLHNAGDVRYVIYPLTLLSNTKLHDKKDLLHLETVEIKGLSYVIASESFDFIDYLAMIEIEMMEYTSIATQ